MYKINIYCTNIFIKIQLIKKTKHIRTFLENTIGDLERYRDDANSKYMVDKLKQLYNVDFEYIIDLDSEKLDIYWQDIVIDSYGLLNIPKDWSNKCIKELHLQVLKNYK